GLCYPPMEHRIKLSPDGRVTGNKLLGAMAAAKDAAVSGFDTPTTANVDGVTDSNQQYSLADEKALSTISKETNTADTDVGHIESSLKGGKLLVIMPLFFLLGLGLAFTPCVLPMVPILSSIIVGDSAQKNASSGSGSAARRRSFMLSVAYVLGMALVYTALGVAAGLAGEGLAATLQNPWVLSAFAVLMVLMALSMFDVYQLQLPASLQTKLSQTSDKQSAGKLAGVFIMGALSALIVGPCVAAPLAGALVYISQTRDVVIGGSALFAMAIGMGVPLLLVGISAGTLLPRAGVWMNAVKRFFGVLMLGVAIWMVSPVIPTVAQMLLWAALGVGYGAYLLWDKTSAWLAKALGLVFIVLGMLQLIGAVTG
ncbi:MAG: protein-disulfide reductase DsbD, partial [Glaciimonas sp.]|nr:protein-disulfide reductase DsbD [Glaciimonas sp.]